MSVIVPVHDGGDRLRQTLDALCASELPRKEWELIVVDDSSSDESPVVASAHADMVVRLRGGPRGPAYARNRGFEVSRGACIAFIDADVVVSRRALGEMLLVLEGNERVGAVMGSYAAPSQGAGVISDYRNLLRHCAQRNSGGETDVLAAGFAAIRRDAFEEAGMYDEWHFQRPQAEALELGNRLRAIGYRIIQSTEVQAEHLKRWNLRSWLLVDLFERGVAISRLPGGSSMLNQSGRTYLSAPIDSGLSWLALALATAVAVEPALPLAGSLVGCIAALLARNARLFRCFARNRGGTFATAAVPLHILACAVWGVAYASGRALYHLLGETQPNPVVQAFSEVGAQTWPPVPTRRD
jgi:GT2 family glycosyltransferase